MEVAHKHWRIEDLPWQAFDPAAVDADLMALVKTAALVEANAAEYVVYLRNVFAGDDAFIGAAERWGAEERLHGAALAAWAQRADPAFDFNVALAAFRAGYRLDLEAQTSVRGSRAGELIARQVVETGTSSFYSALRDAAREPVLKAICARIAQDEYAHFRLFRAHFQRYVDRERLSLPARLMVAFGRFNEADDDELGYAYFAANILPIAPESDYRLRDYGQDYWRAAMRVYRRHHIDNALRMILRAAGLRPQGALFRIGSALLWGLARWRTRRLQSA